MTMGTVVGEMLASAVLKVVMGKLGAVIGPEVSLLWKFKDDFESIRSTLLTLQAVLDDAEKRSSREERVHLWLKRLKFAAYDIHDILEEMESKNDIGCGSLKKVGCVKHIEQENGICQNVSIDKVGRMSSINVIVVPPRIQIDPMSQNSAGDARKMVRLRNLQLKSPRLRIKRLAKVTQLKSSRRKRRGVNYISAARKARTGNVASSSSQRTWNCGNIAGEVDIGDFINFLREKFGCQGTSMNHQRHMTVTGGFSRMNLF
ncbi:unnamed protein product [Miscanthus lutarioriparius]|uniref:Disease resistance N-terminal domain-containing protein n=1 Tax=Miscanthus lutarioriparius TaxID=422564 RepID=A0A811RZP1_9POAL|nr:unnamed protein product [Miscanthus lutarioriparius]